MNAEAADAGSGCRGAGWRGCEVGGGWRTVTLDEGAYPHVAIDPPATSSRSGRRAARRGTATFQPRTTSTRGSSAAQGVRRPGGRRSWSLSRPIRRTWNGRPRVPMRPGAVAGDRDGISRPRARSSGHVLALWNKTASATSSALRPAEPDTRPEPVRCARVGGARATPVYRVQLAVNDAGRALAAWTDVQESIQPGPWPTARRRLERAGRRGSGGRRAWRWTPAATGCSRARRRGDLGGALRRRSLVVAPRSTTEIPFATARPSWR